MVDGRIAAALLTALLPLVSGPVSGAVAAEVLFSESFNGTTLDQTKWKLPEFKGSYLGRTQLRLDEWPMVRGGVVGLALDTFNPTANNPGDSFFGSEIITKRSFARGSGLAFIARSRVVRLSDGPPPRTQIPCGLVTSVFTYRTNDIARDEITFEMLTNDLVAGRHRLLTNVFNDRDFSHPGIFKFVAPAGYDMTRFNTYKMVWKPNQVQWFVNGVLLRTERQEVPDQPMTFRLNFWAPDHFFRQAYCHDLQPAATEAMNERYFYDVDYVRITTEP